MVCFLYICTTESAPGTTLNINRIFLGRCLEYQELTKGTLIQPVKVNCTELWSVFAKAWIHKDPRSIVPSDFDEFFDTAKQTDLPKDKILLWSGTYGIAHEYSNQGRRYVTLEDSLIGYLVNGLTWCGMVCSKCDGINYVECPEFSDLPREANQAFWGGASRTFARTSSGMVRLMVSGTNENRQAYSKESYFGQFELPSLSSDVHLQVILVNFLDKIPLERCNTGSLVALQKDVESRGLSYSCTENPLDVLHLMCVSDPSATKCEIDRPTDVLSAPPSLPDVLSGRVRQRNELQDDFRVE
ncbi:ADP-ribosyl cyclase/cyclic ADP-ribose hydrolase-like isoform X2 [Mercenaria mercenaria]|nr:ADP-ribosyl cyclase/cyclic ADP-ribose hydrolase-like isoform X2 [Mercenaria mercenaria]